jgi:hypothetical protein
MKASIRKHPLDSEIQKTQMNFSRNEDNLCKNIMLDFILYISESIS